MCSCCNLYVVVISIFYLPPGHTYMYVDYLWSTYIEHVLCQAYAEELHERVRRDYWGYSPEESLQAAELHKIHYQVSVL